MALTAAVPDHMGNALRYKDGLGASDNDLIVQTGDVSAYDEFMLMHTTAGALDVFPSLDGTNYATAPLSLIDLGAATSDPVLVTSASRIFAFYGTYAAIRVLQNGAGVPANVCLICSRKGGTR
jgi:hypothetical protein